MEDKTTKRLESLAHELDKRKQQHKESGSTRRRVRRWFRRLLMVIALVSFALASVFFVNFFRLNSDLIEGHVKQGIIPNLTQGRFSLQIGTISGNLLHGVELQNVLVQNPHFKTGATLLTVPRVSMRYSLLDIFFGRLVLQKLHIESPVLTLRRNDEGRGIWDFALASDSLVASAGSAKETVWQKRDRSQALAEQYLADIRVSDLSLLIPAPDRLIADEFAARLVRLPSRTWQVSGVNLSLRKYPAKTFNSHLMRVDLADNPDWMRFQVTTMKENGNFTISFDALGQNFNFGVENIGQLGRRINLYDGRYRDRLNLEWVWSRQKVGLPDKIRGLTGVIRIDELKDLVSGIISDDHELSGSLAAEFACAADKPLYDTMAKVETGSVTVRLPFLPGISDFSASVDIENRRAEFTRITAVVASITSHIRGFTDFADAGQIFTRLDSDLGGEQVLVAATYSRLLPGSHRFNAMVERNAGRADLTFVRSLQGSEISYSDFAFSAGLIASGSAVDILPLKLLPPSANESISRYFSRVDLIGPFKVSSNFSSLSDWRQSDVEIDFNGAKIVSLINPVDSMALYGRAVLSDGVLSLTGFGASVDNLKVGVAGSLRPIAASPFVQDVDLTMLVEVADQKPFTITAERLRASMGLKARPDFDSIELVGNRIASVSLHHEKGCLAELNFERLRLNRRGKALWADNANFTADADWLSSRLASGPENIKLAASLDVFGLPVEGQGTVDFVEKKLSGFSLKGGGSSFARILEALRTQPEGRAWLKKYPLNIAGSFNFAVMGQGDLYSPDLDGWLKFPALQLGLPGFNARLPFQASLKTVEEGYQASIKAGDAAVKIKDVDFKLGDSAADLKITELNASAGANIAIKAESSVFGAALTARGDIKPVSGRFENFKVSVVSSKIEALASEIARIGRFVMPFSLSGKFSALASLDGPFASPSSSGQVSISQLNLDMPLQKGKARTVLTAEKFAGKAEFVKRGNRLFSVEVPEFKGTLLGADVKVYGKARLENSNSGFKPVIDAIKADVSGLELKRLDNFLSAALLPAEIADVLAVEGGVLRGSFALTGTPQKILATGSASLRRGKLGFPAIKDRVNNLEADLAFEGRSDSGYARIGVKNLTGEFGRSAFAVSEGWLEDPLVTGKMSLAGRFSKVFPADMLALLGGLQVAAVSFPEEGWLDGSVDIAGTLGRPVVKADVQSSAMTVRYNSGVQVIDIPIGKNSVAFVLNPDSGVAELNRCELELLGGTVVLRNAKGRFLPGRPFVFDLDGNLHDIDFARLKIDDSEALKGLLSGTIKAAWEEKGSRDAVFNLVFKKLAIPVLPVIDPKTLSKAGAEFLEKPEFSVGQLNFYVTTEEDEEFRGKLLVADGLFAGPHMRFELGNSEFDPQAMQLDARLMINPQSLRQTDIGRKLKKWTVTLQDEKTGIPYVDLSVTGTWDKPELIARAVQKKAERRVKRNFIGRIFGGHRPHKASVEELMQWFPGWKKGM